MRRYQVVVRPEAESDITEVAFYYAQIDDDVAARFLEDFRACVSCLEVFPRAARVVYRDVRRMALDRFPYYVHYRVVGARVSVLAVIHQRRDPDASRRIVLGRR